MRSSTFAAPSKRLYSVCKCKCTKPDIVFSFSMIFLFHYKFQVFFQCSLHKIAIFLFRHLHLQKISQRVFPANCLRLLHSNHRILHAVPEMLLSSFSNQIQLMIKIFQFFFLVFHTKNDNQKPVYQLLHHWRIFLESFALIAAI